MGDFSDNEILKHEKINNILTELSSGKRFNRDTKFKSNIVELQARVCQMRVTSSTSVPNSAWTKIIYDNALITTTNEIENNYDGGIIVKKTGLYLIAVNYYMTASYTAGAFCGIRIVTNSPVTIPTGLMFTNGMYREGIAHTTLCDSALRIALLPAETVLYVEIYQNSGATKSADSNNLFTVARVG